MKTFGNKRVSPDVLRGLMTGVPKHEGCQRVARFVRLGLENAKFTADQISYTDLGIVLGAIDPLQPDVSKGRLLQDALDTERFASEAAMDGHIFTEANAAVTTHTFQVVTGELIGSKIIEGYSAAESVADSLVYTMPARVRNQKLAGFRSLGGSTEVFEGHPYEETGFEEKYVTTSESKRGRILSLTEELLFFDQTGEINRRAMMLGERVRDDRERIMIRGITDADAAASVYVYRPSNSGEALYNTDGSNFNYIGSGNTTSSGFNAAVALADWTDIDSALTYRATQVKDDRLDGDPRPIGGINTGLTLLVPEAKRSAAEYIFRQTAGEKVTNTSADVTHFAGNPIKSRIARVVSSPYVDEESADDWYIGQFTKQFVWSEIWPLQVTTQGGDSEAAFERDVVMRLKARYYGGMSATDTVFVTRVDGA